MGFLVCGNTSQGMTNAYIRCGSGDYSIVQGSELTPDSLVYYSERDAFYVSHTGNYVGGVDTQLIPFSEVPENGYLLEVPDDIINYTSTREASFFKATDLGNNYRFQSFDTSTLSTLRSAQVDTNPLLDSASLDGTVSTALFVGTSIITLIIMFVLHERIVKMIRKLG